ncbi:YhcH/YjgK/YiaL family protein [Parendozoicomonas haliclonae]|uniref:YhcH/YjgK/YiaL family protein n=1 Tax=Parendozoicomonas haliclonae TaxID=1960125 RepID=UPI000B355CD4
MYKGELSSFESSCDLPEAVANIICDVRTRLNQQQEPGHYSVDGDDVFYFIVNDHTQLLAERKSECHKKYIDVQIVLDGEESFGYSLQPFNSLAEDYLQEKDLAFSEDIVDEKFVTVSAGEFVVFDTMQPHRPLVAPDQPAPIKKAVIKIAAASIKSH